MSKTLIAFAVVGAVLCLACMVAGGRADDAAEYQYEEFKKQRAARLKNEDMEQEVGDA